MPRKLEVRSLQSPFTAESLQQFSATLPPKAKIRLVTFTPHELGAAEEKVEPILYLEARWWFPLGKPTTTPSEPVELI